MFQSVEGVYRHGKIELSETPPNIEGARVIVTFLPKSTATAELSAQLQTFAPDEDVLQAIQMSEAELLVEVAIALFQQDRLTLGQASNFARMNQLQFQRLLATREIPLHYDIAELREDVKSLEANGWR